MPRWGFRGAIGAIEEKTPSEREWEGAATGAALAAKRGAAEGAEPLGMQEALPLLGLLGASQVGPDTFFPSHLVP